MPFVKYQIVAGSEFSLFADQFVGSEISGSTISTMSFVFVACVFVAVFSLHEMFHFIRWRLANITMPLEKRKKIFKVQSPIWLHYFHFWLNLFVGWWNHAKGNSVILSVHQVQMGFWMLAGWRAHTPKKVPTAVSIIIKNNTNTTDVIKGRFASTQICDYASKMVIDCQRFFVW